MIKRAKRSAVSLLSAAAAAAALAGILAFYAELKLSRLVLGGLGESFSTRIYAAPFIVDERIASSPDRLMQRLERLGDSKNDGRGPAAHFSWKVPKLKVYWRGFNPPRQAQQPGLFELTRQKD